MLNQQRDYGKMIRQPFEHAEPAPRHTQGVLSHHHIPEPNIDAEDASQNPENMKRVIFATRIDEGRKVTQIIAEVFEQPGHPAQGAANVERIVECWNRFDENDGSDKKIETDMPDIATNFRTAVNLLIGYALTSRSGSPEWLKEMARVINKVAVQLGDADRAVFDGGDGLRVVKEMEDRNHA